MKLKYQARKGNQFGKGANKKAELYGRELQQLAVDNGGSLTPEIAVDAARRNKDWELHNYFLWDDRKAGHQFRLQQARHLIMHIEVIQIEQKIEVGRYRIMHSVQTGQGRAYVPTTTIRMRQDYQAELMDRCLDDFDTWADQYEEIIELVDCKKMIAAMRNNIASSIDNFKKTNKIKQP